MVTNKNDYKIANQIFYNLLKTGELSEKKHKELYLAYLNNAGVREAIDCIKEASKVDIVLISDALYLLPHMDNDILGFDCKKEASLGSSNVEIYLSYLIMTLIFAEFTNEFCPTSHIKVTDLLGLTSDSLEKSANKSDIKELEDIHAFNILAIKACWDAKPPWEENKMGKNTESRNYKIGVIRKVISFLKKEGLLKYISDEDKIVQTDKFKRKMNGYFLDEERKAVIETTFLNQKEELFEVKELMNEQ